MVSQVRYIIFLLSLCIVSACGNKREAKSYEAALDNLDMTISQKSLYENSLRREIDSAQNIYLNSQTLTDQYNSLRRVYELYRSFRIDSALIVAQKRLEVARQIGDKSKATSATLNLAEGYVKSGNAEKAIFLLDTIDRNNLATYHQKYLNNIYRNAYELKAETAFLSSDRIADLKKLETYRDKSLEESDPKSRSYLTLKAEILNDAGLYKEAIAQMEEANKIFDFSGDAYMLYTMGKMYKDGGNQDKAIESLAKSAMLDISQGTKEYKSLILLASLLLQNGDIDRASYYINCAFDDIEFSKANMRSVELMNGMTVIEKAFNETQQERNSRKRWEFAIALSLIAVLFITVILLVRQYMAKHQIVRKTERINRELNEKNEQLKQADILKLRHINSLMAVNATYISRLKGFRKKIYQLLKTGQSAKALSLLKSEKAQNEDISEFQQLFDDAFLSMYPDFLLQIQPYLNSKPELKDGRLTPELRIAALMKLGVSSTDEIAHLLNYSNQTVYNLRYTLKNMLNVSWEEFEKSLR